MTLRNALLISICLPLLLFAQTPPAIDWQRSFGSSQGDEGRAIAVDELGNFYVAGSIENGPNGSWDYTVTKLDPQGATLWQHIYGGSGYDKPDVIVRTPTGELFVLGSSPSTDGDVTGNHGASDAWLLKLDQAGDLIWEKSFGGPGDDLGWGMTLDNDNNLILACLTDGAGGDVGNHIGGADFWIVKCDLDGSMIWERTYGGSGDDFASNVQPTADGGCVVGGGTRSIDGDISRPAVDGDIWIVKLAVDGTLQWETSLGGSGSEGGRVLQRSDGGYVVFGNTNSSDGDVSVALGSTDIWIAHLDITGALTSERSYGGTGADSPRSMFEIEGGGYFICANTSSSNGDVVGYHGGFYDLWSLRIDEGGNILWQKPLGGSADDRCLEGAIAPDGSLALVGFSNSTNGDVTSAFPGYDSWVVKLAADNVSVAEGIAHFGLVLYPNPASEVVCVRSIDRHVTSYNAEVVDVLGRTWPVGTDDFVQSDGLSFRVADLPAGMYFVRVAIDGRFVALPFVKE